jgi:hypothetical protein
MQSPRLPLLSEPLDLAMVGGASFFFFILFYLLFERIGLRVPLWSDQLQWFLGFAVAYPHFSLSYQLLYLDYRKKVLKTGHFLFVSVIVPCLLLLLLVVAYASKTPALIQFLVFAMYTLVGWHYVKQSYGAMIVFGVRARYSLGNYERLALRIHLYLIWITSLLPAQLLSAPLQDFRGIPRYNLRLPNICLPVFQAMVVLSFLPVVFWAVRRYRQQQEAPSLTMILAYFSALWLLPSFRYSISNYPIFFWYVPIFHAIQYFLFVLAFKKNQMGPSPDLREKGSASWASFKLSKTFVLCRYVGGAVVLGALSFVIVPDILEHFFGSLGGSATMGSYREAFWLFLNLHHFFIDSALWKGSHAEIRAYLLHPVNKAPTLWRLGEGKNLDARIACVGNPKFLAIGIKTIGNIESIGAQSRARGGKIRLA